MLVRLGVDGVITNVPGRAREVIEGRWKRATRVGGVSAEPKSAGRERRIDMLEGDSTLRQFLQFLSDSTGKAVVAGASMGNLDATINLAARITDADDTIVKALLDVNGYVVRERTLDSGRKVLIVEAASKPGSVIPEKRPVIRVGSSSSRRNLRTGRTESRRPPDGRRAGNGLTLSPVPAALRVQLDLPRGAGVLVAAIDDGATAGRPDLASLQRHDVVTHVGDERIETGEAFVEALNRYARGDEFTLRVVRRGRTRILRVKR